MKKGRHRRFEEARALKRSHDVDLEDLFEDMVGEDDEENHKPEHDAWADLAEEWETKTETSASDESDEDDLEHDEAAAD